jgi:hypothetical protein
MEQRKPEPKPCQDGISRVGVGAAAAKSRAQSRELQPTSTEEESASEGCSEAIDYVCAPQYGLQ